MTFKNKTIFLFSILTFCSCIFLRSAVSSDNRETIENLADGNYRYCSEPASIENMHGFDGEAWCFEFHKKGMNVVGTYRYQAPKDTAYICIDGIVEDNLITGIGYEIVQYGETKPDVHQEIREIPRSTQFMSENGYWDDYREANNLKVGSPSFYKLIEPEQPGSDYWA